MIKKKKDDNVVESSGDSAGSSSEDTEEEDEVVEVTREQESMSEEVVGEVARQAEIDEELENLDTEDNSSWDLLSQPPQSPFFGPVK